MKKRWIALLLAAAMVMSLFAGCGDKSADSENPGISSSMSVSKGEKQTQRLNKLAFQPQWLEMDLDDCQLEYISGYLVEENTMYFYGDCVVGTQRISTETGDVVDDSYEGDTYQNTVYETQMFKMDLTEQTVTRLEGYASYELPEGVLGNSYVQGIQAGADGSVWIREQVNTYSFDLPENFDESEESKYQYYVAGETMYLLHQLGADGALLQTVTINLEPESYYNDTMVLEGTGVLASSYDRLDVYDLTGAKTGSIELENTEQLLKMADGVYAKCWQDGGYVLVPVDLTAMTAGEGQKTMPNAYTIYPGNDTYDYIYDSNGIFYGHIPGGEEQEQLFSWLDCDVDSNNLWGYPILADNGYVYALESDYDNTNQSYQYSLIVMEPVDPDTLPQKQELVLGCMYLLWNMRNRIVEFNRSHDDVRIVVKDYSQYATEDSTNAGLQKLSTELMSGTGPDIFLLTSDMPVSQYEAKGFFQDLWPLIDSDAELSREDLMEHFFEALSVDGKLYRVAGGFNLSTVVGKESVVGAGESWTMEELMAALESQPEGTTIFGAYDTRSSILENVIARNADNFINWQDQTCSFDSEEFISYLEFAMRFPEEINYEDGIYDDASIESDALRLRRGNQMLYRTTLYSFSELVYASNVFGETVNFIGYPTNGGNSSYFSVDSALAISASCANTEAAWEFIRTELTEDYQTSSYSYYFPTNRHAFEAQAQNAMTVQYEDDESYGEKRPIPMTYIWYGQEDSQEIYHMTQEEYDTFWKLYESCNSFYAYNMEITDLITDQCSAYFAGQKTAEETARLIQDRVGLYVMENS